MEIVKSIKIQKAFLAIAIMMLLQVSCLNQKFDKSIDKDIVKPYPHIINIREGFNNTSQIKLSEIVDSISYIVLSKDKQEIIGSVSKIQITDSNIYLRRSDGIVMRYDLTGKFLNSFGNIGRGPKEYLPGSIFTTTPNDDRIIVFRSAMDSYLTYESNGSYIKTCNFPIPRTMFDLRSLSDSVFLCTFYYVGSFMKDYIQNSINWLAGLFDMNANPITLLEHPLKNINISESDNRNVLSMAPSLTFFNNRIILMPPGDTIYEVTEKSIFKGFIINWGQIPHKKGNEELFFRQIGSSNKVSIGPIILETYDRTYLRVSRGNESYLFEYNKINGSIRSMLENPDNPGFINDLDGGVNFYPYYTNRAGDIWVIDIDAFSFKENHSPELLNKSTALDPKLKEKLKTFTDNLNLDDNPVLKIVFLKTFNLKDKELQLTLLL